MRWCPDCVRSSNACLNEKKHVRQLKGQIQKCKKVRQLLQRDLEQVRKLHRKEHTAHLQDGGRQGEALEINLLSQIRAADVKIIEYQNLIQAIKEKREQQMTLTRQKDDKQKHIPTFECGGDVDIQLQVQQARVMQELKSLFANNTACEMKREGAQNQGEISRRKSKIGGFRGYYQTFMYF